MVGAKLFVAGPLAYAKRIAEKAANEASRAMNEPGWISLPASWVDQFAVCVTIGTRIRSEAQPRSSLMTARPLREQLVGRLHPPLQDPSPLGVRRFADRGPEVGACRITRKR